MRVLDAGISSGVIAQETFGQRSLQNQPSGPVDAALLLLQRLSSCALDTKPQSFLKTGRHLAQQRLKLLNGARSQAFFPTLTVQGISGPSYTKFALSVVAWSTERLGLGTAFASLLLRRGACEPIHYWPRKLQNGLLSAGPPDLELSG